MTIEYTFNVLNILSNIVSAKGSTMVGLAEKNFEIKAVRWLENAILKLDVANTVFHKRAILLIFEAEFTESIL